MIQYRGFKDEKYRVFETEPGVKLDFRGPDSQRFVQVNVPKRVTKVVRFELTVSAFRSLILLSLDAGRCRRSGCTNTNDVEPTAYCSLECYNADCPNAPPPTHLDCPVAPPTHTPHSKALEAKLLTMGGKRACVFGSDYKPTDDDGFTEVLMHAGRLSSGENVRLKRMEVSNCHGNAYQLVRDFPHLYQFETGYALGADGVWRRHSWVFDGSQIVETTEHREKYFGVTCQGYDDEIGDRVPVAAQQENSAVPA